MVGCARIDLHWGSVDIVLGPGGSAGPRSTPWDKGYVPPHPVRCSGWRLMAHSEGFVARTGSPCFFVMVSWPQDFQTIWEEFFSDAEKKELLDYLEELKERKEEQDQEAAKAAEAAEQKENSVDKTEEGSAEPANDDSSAAGEEAKDDGK